MTNDGGTVTEHGLQIAEAGFNIVNNLWLIFPGPLRQFL